MVVKSAVHCAGHELFVLPHDWPATNVDTCVQGFDVRPPHHAAATLKLRIRTQLTHSTPVQCESPLEVSSERHQNSNFGSDMPNPRGNTSGPRNQRHLDAPKRSRWCCRHQEVELVRRASCKCSHAGSTTVTVTALANNALANQKERLACAGSASCHRTEMFAHFLAAPRNSD